MIFVTGRGKTAIVEHFDHAFELESTLRDRAKTLDVLEPTRIQPGNLVTVRQQVPMGLGHAIWCARAIVGDEPFAIFLPDELMIGSPGCMKQMIDAYKEVGGNLISVLEVPREEVSSYGVIAPGRRLDDTLTEVTGLVEKPKTEEAPSNLIISGRYILQPQVMRTLECQEKGAGGEIQLTDAMARMRAAVPRRHLRRPPIRLRLEDGLRRGHLGPGARTPRHGGRSSPDHAAPVELNSSAVTNSA
jgi:UTP--glucose-1-phosphate uridylyltransferase